MTHRAMAMDAIQVVLCQPGSECVVYQIGMAVQAVAFEDALALRPHPNRLGEILEG